MEAAGRATSSATTPKPSGAIRRRDPRLVTVFMVASAPLGRRRVAVGEPAGLTPCARPRLYKEAAGRGSILQVASAKLGEHGEAVGTERLAGDAGVERCQGDELAAHDLLRLEPEGAVVDRPVRHPVHDDPGVRVLDGEEGLDLERDAQLLARLAPRAVVERLAGGEDPADRHVPVPREHVLPGGPEVDEELSAPVEHEHVRGTMREAAGAHLAPRHGPDGTAGVVDDVDELAARIPDHGSSPSSRPPIAASSSGVFTLVRLRAAPRTRRSSASLTQSTRNRARKSRSAYRPALRLASINGRQRTA